ncbi:MAG: ribosome maturation factor RimP [Succinivibrionaceae bacterium]|nr:ribosome maturation factor RimP [Succinivibrionaceae bacterium]
MAVIKDQIKDVIQPTIEGMGYILWGIEFKHVGRKSFLTVYIDKDGGVSIEDCSDVSRQISSVLDVEDLISYAYDLEVSSPGLDRLFFNIEQFKQYINEKIDIELNMPMDNHRKFKGLLVAVADNIVTVKLDDDTSLDIMYPNIKKARLVPNYDFSKKEEK